MKLAVFDFDSTLMDGETIDFLAEEMGVSQQIAQITKKAMQGELDFYESLKTRVKLLEGMPQKKAVEICHNLPLNLGAKETIAELKKNGYKVVCFSGGFKFATEYFRDILGLDGEFSNTLHCKNGKLTGEVGGEMMFDFSKGTMLSVIQRLLNVCPKNTLVVGDGANDISMFAYAEKKIAFCAKEILKQQANIIIDKKDLREILSHIKSL
ncbi:phosphoserine phosphatase SerB [Helicobacter cappadocius]|uniref:Phosphoserine phosphatase n=1 Tax=Helicobacter cappadocius TaxID=3063998 RepID=A0AA90PT93_9HELI|nr:MULTISPECIES: phosphoserine phosphatase SerB [unclassified Helicobacter]MDO7253175.1 phosphoserine phosphatase SerB [Helicobacter sp. faydin-H75]MDP2539099.1 phosphoserine phosphatase SerB [Helicobacter sp. faydin-H76]